MADTATAAMIAGMDGSVGQRNNAVTRYTEFDELFPTVCRFVRLTITDWPHLAGAPLGVLEFTVFGNAVASAKAAAAEAKK